MKRVVSALSHLSGAATRLIRVSLNETSENRITRRDISIANSFVHLYTLRPLGGALMEH